MDQLLATLRAMADETRLRILRLLAEEELSVTEIAAVLKSGQPAISRHLGMLRTAGLLSMRRDGQRALYRLAPAEGTPTVLWKQLAAAVAGARGADADRTALEEILALRLAGAADFFDQRAADWDRLRTRLVDEAAPFRTVAALAPTGRVIVDVGSGTGAMLPLLAPNTRRILAVDRSRSMLARARANTRQANLLGVEFLRGDMTALPLADGAADGLLATMVLHHAEHPGAALAEFARVLKTGGRLALLDLSAHDDRAMAAEHGDRWLGFAPDVLEDHLAGAGLDEIRVEMLPTRDRRPALVLASATRTKANPHHRMKGERR